MSARQGRAGGGSDVQVGCLAWLCQVWYWTARLQRVQKTQKHSDKLQRVGGAHQISIRENCEMLPRKQGLTQCALAYLKQVLRTRSCSHHQRQDLGSMCPLARRGAEQSERSWQIQQWPTGLQLLTRHCALDRCTSGAFTRSEILTLSWWERCGVHAGCDGCKPCPKCSNASSIAIPARQPRVSAVVRSDQRRLHHSRRQLGAAPVSESVQHVPTAVHSRLPSRHNGWTLCGAPCRRSLYRSSAQGCVSWVPRAALPHIPQHLRRLPRDTMHTKRRSMTT